MLSPDDCELLWGQDDREHFELDDLEDGEQVQDLLPAAVVVPCGVLVLLGLAGVVHAHLDTVPQDVEGLHVGSQGVLGALLDAAPQDVEGLHVGDQGVLVALLGTAPLDVEDLAVGGQGVLGALLPTAPGCGGP